MEFAELKAAAERARRFTHEIDGRRFELVTPTQFAVDVLTEDKRTLSRVSRAVLLAALRGWSNVTTDDLNLAAGEVTREPLVYSAEAAELLLDERPDWQIDLVEAVSIKVKERRERFEASQGN